MSEELQIIDFWEQKKHYTDKNVLKQKAREYYSEDFINNYTRWKANVDELNVTMSEHMSAKQFPMKYWSHMTYDWFCKQINDLIEEWIEVNANIEPNDIYIIIEKLMADHIAIQFHEYQQHAFSIPALLDSIKTARMH